MKIIFEDGREVETENPVRVLTEQLIGKPQDDYIFIMEGYRKYPYECFYVNEVCVYLDDEYKWIRNWWSGFCKIRILYITSVSDAGNAVISMMRSIWDV